MKKAPELTGASQKRRIRSMKGTTMQWGMTFATMRWAVVTMPGVHTHRFALDAARDRRTTLLETDASGVWRKLFPVVLALGMNSVSLTQYGQTHVTLICLGSSSWWSALA